LLEGTIDRSNKRMTQRLATNFLIFNKNCLKIEKIKTVDIDIIDEVLSITRDIASAYKELILGAKRRPSQLY
jgi:flagellin-specific chaperone FliS